MSLSNFWASETETACDYSIATLAVAHQHSAQFRLHLHEYESLVTQLRRRSVAEIPETSNGYHAARQTIRDGIEH